VCKTSEVGREEKKSECEWKREKSAKREGGDEIYI